MTYSASFCDTFSRKLWVQTKHLLFMHAQYLISIQLILQAPLKLFQNSLGVRIQSSPTFFVNALNMKIIFNLFCKLFWHSFKKLKSTTKRFIFHECTIFNISIQLILQAPLALFRNSLGAGIQSKLRYLCMYKIWS